MKIAKILYQVLHTFVLIFTHIMMSIFEAKEWLPDQLLSTGMSSAGSLSKPGISEQLSLQEEMPIHILRCLVTRMIYGLSHVLYYFDDLFYCHTCISSYIGHLHHSN